jgi:hypothetical protein
MASRVHLGVVVQLLVVGWPGMHQSVAGDDNLQRRTTVTVGSTDERERETEKKIRRS